MARNVEITNAFLQPIYDRMKVLIPTLGYEIPIFRPGKPAIQSIKKTQMLLVINSYVDGREPKTLGGGMWDTTGRFVVMLSAPERVPGLDIHTIATDFSNYLVDYYTNDFCNNIRQTYVNEVFWETDVDELNRSEYITTLIYRYYDYPQVKEG